MPTGYTQTLMEKGQSFSDFAKGCAHAFGALITLRDDGITSDIPEFKPSLYHLEALEKAKALRHELLEMTDAERIIYGEKKRTEAVKHHEEWLAREHQENIRLMAMRDSVNLWQPPTTEHTSLKAFMLEQVNISINDLDYIQKLIREDKAKFAKDYYDTALAGANRDIEYHTKANMEENERVANRNRWVQQLTASLGSRL